MVEQEIVADRCNECQCKKASFRFSLEGVRHCNAEITLACIEIFRQDACTTDSLGSGDNHSVVEMKPIGLVGLSRPTYEIIVHRDEPDR